MEKLFNKLKKNQIHPVIAKRVALGDVAEAHVILEKGKARGPIVCIPWKRGSKLSKEDDNVPHEIHTNSHLEEVREEESVLPEDRSEAQRSKRGLFRRSKVHGDDVREGGVENDEKSKRSRRSFRKKKNGKRNEKKEQSVAGM